MKKFFFTIGVVSSLILGGCSEDVLHEEDTGTTVADKDHVCYVRVAISTQGMQSRADSNEFTNGDAYGEDGYQSTNIPDFEYGQDAESVIDNIVFVFYDKAGNQVGERTTLPMGDFTLGTLTNPTDYADGNVGTYYTSIVPVTILKGQGKPAQIMAFVNPSQTTDLNFDLKSIMTVKRNDVRHLDPNDKTKKKFFYSMSNSVYYDEDAEGNMKVIRAAQIPVGGAFESLEEAKAAVGDENTTAVINVERYAAKVRLRVNDGDNFNEHIEDVTPDNFKPNPDNVGEKAKFKLTFKPNKWALNAIDDLTFVTKVFLEEDGFGSYGSIPFTFSVLNEKLGNNNGNYNVWKWNASDKNRSFWGFSPAYYKSTYPEVASDYTSENFDIDYISYNNLVALNNGVGQEAGTYVYTKETTVGTKGFNSNNPYASLPSIVYGGVYSVITPGESGEYTPITEADGTTPITFYINKVAGSNVLLFEANPEGASTVAGGESLMADIADRQGSLFLTTTTTVVSTTSGVEVEGTKVETSVTEQVSKSNLDKVARWFIIKHPSKDVLNGVKVPSRKVTLQVMDADEMDELNVTDTEYNYSLAPTSEDDPDKPDSKIKTTITYQLGYGNGTTVENVTADNLNAANRTLTAASLYADKYINGSAYFNIPILHLGWYRAGNDNANTNFTLKKSIDFSKVHVGDFGIIRNHVYDIFINSISGLGTGIGNPDHPIIPENNGQTYYVNFRLNILNWAVVPTQSMDL